jgi:hypothetical protein
MEEEHPWKIDGDIEEDDIDMGIQIDIDQTVRQEDIICTDDLSDLTNQYHRPIPTEPQSNVVRTDPTDRSISLNNQC